MKPSDRAIVINGGELGSAPPFKLDQAAIVIACDSGLAFAKQLGLRVDLAVGDFDSVSPGLIEEAQLAGTKIERYPTNKDSTDFEIAIETAISHGARDITVVGGSGGRFDHLLGNIMVLTSSWWRGVALRAWMNNSLITVLDSDVGSVELTGHAGAVVTLLPVHQPALGVTSTGLKYPLNDDTLLPGSSRGVSNELVGSQATLTLRGGTLLVLQPAELSG